MHDTPAERPESAQHEEFLRLFLANQQEIFRYVVALVPNITDAQDIVQQTAIALWRKFAQYDRSKPFAPWASRFALNEVRQFVRCHSRWHAFMSEELLDHLSRRQEELAEHFEERLAHLSLCLQKLPTAQRQILEAYYYRQENIDHIGMANGKSAEAVYKILQRVRTVLRVCLNRTSSAPLGSL